MEYYGNNFEILRKSSTVRVWLGEPSWEQDPQARPPRPGMWQAVHQTKPGRGRKEGERGEKDGQEMPSQQSSLLQTLSQIWLWPTMAWGGGEVTQMMETRGLYSNLILVTVWWLPTSVHPSRLQAFGGGSLWTEILAGPAKAISHQPSSLCPACPAQGESNSRPQSPPPSKYNITGSSGIIWKLPQEVNFLRAEY